MVESDKGDPKNGQGATILVVEDDASYGELLRYQLSHEGYSPTVFKSGEEALKKLADLDPSVVLLDVMLPGKSGRDLLTEIHGTKPELPIIMMTAAGSVELAVTCIKAGAYDFLTKPFDFDRLKSILHNALKFRELEKRVRRLEGALAQQNGFDHIVAHSPLMRIVVDQSQRAAISDSDVLILGESGVGKEVLSRAIHFNSARRKGPFVAINCGAIPDGLMESELFGHEKGAFTGAASRRIGCFEQANGGTLFLDEIGEMRADMQVRLLRALEQREVRRVGSDKTIKVDVRVISATNQDIKLRMSEQTFRTDLYYRLAILVLSIPALRDRKEDVGPLAQSFFSDALRDGLTRITKISESALQALLGYDWPGNVRELRNAIERALVFEDSTEISLGSLPPEIVRMAYGQEAVPEPKINETIVLKAGSPLFDAMKGFREQEGLKEMSAQSGQQVSDISAPPGAPSGVMPAHELLDPSDSEGLPQSYAGQDIAPPPGPDEIRPMDEEEKNILLRALSITGGNISEAARRLGLHRSTLHRKMTRYGLATEEDGMIEG